MFLSTLLAVRIAVVGDIGSGTEAIARGIARINRESPIEAIITTLVFAGWWMALRRWIQVRPKDH